MEIFQDMEGLECIHVEILVQNQDMENYQDVEIFQDKEAKHHTHFIIK